MADLETTLHVKIDDLVPMTEALRAAREEFERLRAEVAELRERLGRVEQQPNPHLRWQAWQTLGGF